MSRVKSWVNYEGNLYLEISKYGLSFWVVKTWWDFYTPASAVKYGYQEHERNLNAKERRVMKGYNTENGYMGYVNGEYQLFACEADYEEWMED